MSDLIIEKSNIECKKCPMFEQMPNMQHHSSWLKGKDRMGWCHRYNMEAGNWYYGLCYHKIQDSEADKPIVKLWK